MKARNWLKLPVAAALAAGLAVAATGIAAAQTRIVMSNDNNALGVKGKTFEMLKAELEKRLGDKVKVELHHSGALFDQKTQVQGLQLGGTDMIAPTSGIYSPVAPNLNALSLPFLFTSLDQIQAAMDDETVRATFMPDLESKNILPVAIWSNGQRDLSYRQDEPILEPSQMAGVKIRVQSVPVDIATMKAVGANVVSMSWGEVPTAVQQGVIDAVEPTPNALVGAGLHEMVKNTTKIGYKFSFYIVSVNKMWWNGLPEDVRTAFTESLDAATKWNWENVAAENEKAYEKAAAAGDKIHELTAEQRQKWVEAVQPVWKEFGEDKVGAEAMAALRKIAGQ